MAAKKDKLPRWDLSDFYPSKDSKEFKADLVKYENKVKAFAKKYEGKIVKLSGDSLASAIAEYEQISELSGKISSYAYLLFSTQVIDEKVSAFFQNTCDYLNEIDTHIVFFSLELVKISDADLKKKFSASKKLTNYAPYLRDVRIYKPHWLSHELERYITETSNTGWVRLFDETHASLKYNFRGKQLENAEIFNKMSSADRKVRADAAKAVSETLGNNIRIFTMVTNVLAKEKAIADKWRNYEKPISSRNLSNLVEDEVVDALISSVKKSYPKLSHRYFKWKAKALGLKKLEYWDRNAPLPGMSERYIPFSEAQEIVLDAFGNFSPTVAKTAKQFFDKSWIDAEPRKGKESGAYSHPTVTNLHPYILMNYLGKTNDVMTLAHELGHGVHQCLARKQGGLISGTPLTLAETASVFGEQLVFRSFIEKEKNQKKRRLMIADKVEDMLNTVVRQVAFCEFERQVHDQRKKGELSSDDIGKIWMQTQSESLGSAVNLAPQYKYSWSYIPHFIHTPFYVYAYAFGDCLVNSLYAVYLSGMKDFESKYLNMLESGGKYRHKELLAPFGLDASKPDFWQKGISIISNFIDELED